MTAANPELPTDPNDVPSKSTGSPGKHQTPPPPPTSSASQKQGSTSDASALPKQAAEYAREKWDAFEQWRHTTEQSAAQRRPTYASLLLAMACYTRGLWHPLFMWRTLLPGPYRCPAVPWRMDGDFVCLHLRLATVYVIPWTLAELLLLSLYWGTGDPVTGSLFVLTVLTQWFIFPWWMAGRLWEAHGQHCSTNREVLTPPLQLVVTDESGGQIRDLGFLLREANFSIDSEQRLPRSESPADQQPPTREEFFQRLEAAFADSPDIVTQRVEIRGIEEVQPGSPFWPRWNAPFSSPSVADESNSHQRLLIFGQHREVDGLTTVELDIQHVKSHLSFKLRLRWLPPLSNRIRRLRFVAQELFGWRLIALPLFWLLLLYLQTYPATWILGGLRGDMLSVELSIDNATLAQAESEADARLASEPEWEEWMRLEAEGAKVAALREQLEAAYVRQAISSAEYEDRSSKLDREMQVLIERDEKLRPELDRLEKEHRADTIGFTGRWHRRVARYMILAVARRIQDGSPVLLAVLTVAVIALLPLPIAMLLAIWRALRVVWGYAAAANRAHVNVMPPVNLRQLFITSKITDADGFRWCTAYLQIIEEILTNRIVDALRERGLETSSIRQEMSVFINEGIYMTGGNLQAENVLVGRRGIIRNILGPSRSSRHGQVALMRSGGAKSG